MAVRTCLSGFNAPALVGLALCVGCGGPSKATGLDSLELTSMALGFATGAEFGEPDRTARSSAAFERATLFASGDGGGRDGAAGRPGADDNGASDAEKERAETGARARIGERHRFTMSWQPAEPCPLVEGVSVTLDGVAFGAPGSIGWTVDGHAGEVCMSTAEWTMAVGDLPPRGRDLTVVVSDGATSLTFVVPDLARARHLVPEAPVRAVSPGQRLLFLGPPAPPQGRRAPTVRLVPPGKRAPPIEIPATGAGDDVVADLPASVPPGEYTLAASALSEVEAVCPAPACSARLASRFIGRVTVAAP